MQGVSLSFCHSLFLSESERLLYRDGHLVLQGVVGLVRRQIQTVEAGVRLRQSHRVTRLLDGEPSGAIRTLQILEAVDGDTRGTRGELQQTRLLLGVPAADDLPEVLDDLVLLLVAAVVGVLLPVVNVDVGDTTNEQLQLALVENVDKVSRDQLVESGHERVELLLNPLHDLPLRHQLNVLRLVLVGDGNVPTTGYQINGAALSKLLIIHGESELNNSLNIIIPTPKVSIMSNVKRWDRNLQGPRQVAMQIFIDTLHIL